MKKYYLLLIILILFCFGCDISDGYTEADNKRVLFEIEYRNSAWGYVHTGKYIDSNGDVYSYSFEFNDKPWLPTNYYYLTEKELMNKYDHNKLFVKRINPRDVHKMAYLIPLVDKAQYSEELSIGVDMGSSYFICYIYIPDSKLYKRIDILTDGDWYYKKESAAADKVITWLRDNLI